MKIELKKLCSYFGKEYTDEERDKLAQLTSFESMRKYKPINEENAFGKQFFFKDMQFFRKAEIGQWKTYFTPKMSHDLETILHKNLKCKLSFNYG